jgi:hypothetical protein
MVPDQLAEREGVTASKARRPAEGSIRIGAQHHLGPRADGEIRQHDQEVWLADLEDVREHRLRVRSEGLVGERIELLRPELRGRCGREYVARPCVEQVEG